MLRLKELRDEFNLKVRSFDEFGFSKNMINNIELQISNVDNEKIELFCKIFDVSADYFLGLSDDGVYAYYNGVKYCLNRDDFFEYKSFDCIKYDDRKRILVVPDNKEIVSLISKIPFARIVDKK